MSKLLYLALLLLATTGLALRSVGINQPLVDFHPLRHYRSALIARACFDDARPETPAWARTIADNNRAMQPEGEPPLMESAACAIDLLQGRENIEFPRILSALCWIVGALPVFFISRRLLSAEAALVAVALYLFMPYAVIATRTFQPDPLMTMCGLWAALALVRCYDQPTRARLIVAGLLVGLATIVKPMSIFFTVPLVLCLSRGRGLRWLFNREVVGLLVLGLGPAAVYYGRGVVFGSLVHDQFHGRFVPSLLPTSFFWQGWLAQIRRVFGLPIFLTALAGTFAAPRAIARRMLIASWLGYIGFAIADTYHIPTHDYYHLPYVPVVALGAAAAFEWLRVRASRAASTVTPALAYALAIAIAVWGAWTVRPKLILPGAEATVASYERIGELTHHDSKVLFLDLEYGYPLMYHGQMSGDEWPNTDDLNAERIQGMGAVSAQNRFAKGYASYHPHYFVVTDLDSLDAQPDLQKLLAEKATLVEQTSRYRVYKFTS